MIAVDAGSNQVSVLRIRPSGSLRLVSHGVVSSGGLMPDSVAVFGDLVYLANSGAGGSNYTGFRLRPNGRLDPIPGSTVSLSADAAPGDVLFNGTGTKLAGTEVGTSLIDSFTVGSGGRLTAAPGSPFKAEGLGPFGSEFRPADPGQLFVSNAHNTATDSGTVSAFTDSADGTLSPVAGSPFADGQMALCWVEITHDGQFLFTVNTASGAISRYRIAPGGALMLLGSTPAGQAGGVGAVDARLSPDGGFLYVHESRIGRVGAFTVHGGNLTELPSSRPRCPQAPRPQASWSTNPPARQTGTAASPRGSGRTARWRITCGPLHRHTRTAGTGQPLCCLNRAMITGPAPWTGCGSRSGARSRLPADPRGIGQAAASNASTPGRPALAARIIVIPMLPVRAQALAAAQHPRRVCHQVKGVMAVLLAARGDEPDRGGQIRRDPGPDV